SVSAVHFDGDGTFEFDFVANGTFFSFATYGESTYDLDNLSVIPYNIQENLAPEP
nr:hypothetical protein [Candidatus Brocadiales bacterium]